MSGLFFPMEPYNVLQHFKDIKLLASISYDLLLHMGFPGGTGGKDSIWQCRYNRYETQVQSVGQEDPLEEGLATHSSILAWRIPWTEEPNGVHGVAKHQT